MIDARFVYMAAPAKLPRVKAKFRSSYIKILKALESELRHLGARQITIQAGYSQIRNDGWPYSTARSEHPACVLQFLDRKGEQLTFKSSKFATFDDNLYAISLTLESLRAVDRYGVVEGEQYAGFKQLAAPGAIDGTMNKKTAMGILASMSGWNAAQVLDDPKGAYRAAAHNAHPDHGGTQEVMVSVNQAWKVLNG